MKLVNPLRVGPVERLSLGLVALVICLVMLVDLGFGLLPDGSAAARDSRLRFGGSLAVQLASLLEAGDDRTLGNTLQQVVGRNPDVLTLAVRRGDGKVLAERGPHARLWASPTSGRSTANHLSVPVQAGSAHWGDVEITFAETAPQGPLAWLHQPNVILLVVLGVGGFLLFYAYLRRAMQYLDPASAVPDRVRKAFDVLAEGIMVLDAQGRIVLVNAAMRHLHPGAAEELRGERPSDLPWLRGAVEALPDREGPWDRALRDSKPIAGEPLEIRQPDGSVVATIIGCAPILDAGARQRGCIVTFDDVSELHASNAKLRSALAEIEASREQIRAQNEDLRRLATRDPLTGLLNRRAFYDGAKELLVAALRRNGEICCVMGDIDHFKQFNDDYGHGVGDQVIQVVARTLSSHIRQGDVLCRYGGEEFCIVLPNTTLEEAHAVAERARLAIAETAASGVRGAQVRRITSSFGVTVLSSGLTTLEELMEQADQALYASKKAGRNRVTRWSPPAP